MDEGIAATMPHISSGEGEAGTSHTTYTLYGSLITCCNSCYLGHWVIDYLEPWLGVLGAAIGSYSSLTYTPTNPCAAARVLGIQGDYTLEAIIPVGKPHRARKESRLGLAETVYLIKWGNPINEQGARGRARQRGYIIDV